MYMYMYTHFLLDVHVHQAKSVCNIQQITDINAISLLISQLRQKAVSSFLLKNVVMVELLSSSFYMYSYYIVKLQAVTQ